MDILTSINYPAVLIVSLIYYVIGFLWYTKFFGGLWRKETGMPAEKKPQPGALLGQFISTFLFSLGIAILLKMGNVTGIKDALLIGIFVTVFFAVPINSGNLFFTGKKRLFALDTCERTIGSLTASTILYLWQ